MLLDRALLVGTPAAPDARVPASARHWSLSILWPGCCRPPSATDTSSPAERAMFAHIRDELSNDWIVLHSLGLTIHHAKPWAEIDFVLIGPPGVICLEVKGGLVSRRTGSGTPRRNVALMPVSRDVCKESPFEQVGSASAQLHRFLLQRLPEGGQGDYGLCGRSSRCGVDGQGSGYRPGPCI